MMKYRVLHAVAIGLSVFVTNGAGAGEIEKMENLQILASVDNRDYESLSPFEMSQVSGSAATAFANNSAVSIASGIVYAYTFAENKASVSVVPSTSVVVWGSSASIAQAY